MGEDRLHAARATWEETRARAWDEAMEQYRRAVADAWDDYRMAMIDCVQNGWSKADIARSLGVSPQRVGQLIDVSMRELLAREGTGR